MVVSNEVLVPVWLDCGSSVINCKAGFAESAFNLIGESEVFKSVGNSNGLKAIQSFKSVEVSCSG